MNDHILSFSDIVELLSHRRTFLVDQLLDLTNDQNRSNALKVRISEIDMICVQIGVKLRTATTQEFKEQ